MFCELNVHDKEWSGWPSVITEGFVYEDDQNYCEIWQFTISLMSYDVYASKMLIVMRISKRLGSSLKSLKWFEKKGNFKPIFHRCRRITSWR